MGRGYQLAAALNGFAASTSRSVSRTRHFQTLVLPQADLNVEIQNQRQRTSPLPGRAALNFDVNEGDLPEEDSETGPLRLGTGAKLHFFTSGALVKRYNSSDAISYARLRDNCKCAKCIDPSTRQKLRTSGSVKDAQMTKAHEGFDQAGTSGIYIHWRDKHVSFYRIADVMSMVDYNMSKTNINQHFKRVFWDRAILNTSPLRMTYDEVQTPDGLYKMLGQAQKFGLVIVSEVPTEQTGDKECELRRFMNKIGEIRNTFYGETWNVKSMVNSKNVAYTSQDLGFHMDLLYFTSPPRFQALHCLQNRVQGGSSYFADTFYAGRYLQHTDPAAANVLAKYPLDFEYDNDGHTLRCRHFVLNSLDTLRSHVNWSPPFQAPTRRITRSRTRMQLTIATERELYDALAKFEEALARPETHYEFLLKEGDLVFFDNRRVVHARREFGPGERWLKGCYLDGDAVWDKLATLYAHYS